MTTYETIKYEVDDSILTITLHRPDRMNAFTYQMCKELVAAFDAADADDNVRVVILTGEGRAFCAGADLGAGGDTFNMKETSEEQPLTIDNPKIRDTGGMVSMRIFESRKPVIAAINGPAVGIGITMTLPCDVRLAADNAKMGFVFAKRGIVPEAASSWFLPRIVGISQAMEWCATGRVFSAQEAKEGGLVSQVVPADELMTRARALANEMAKGTSAVSVSLIRSMMWQMLTADHPIEAHKLDSRLIFLTGKSDDAKEGVMSFVEKRQAEYPGKVSADMPEIFPWWKPRDYK